MIYLDHNATTPLHPEVAELMAGHLRAVFGNPSSIHKAGRDARAAIDNARDGVAALLGAKPHEIIFTGGGTESDNLAIVGLARCRSDRGKHLVTCATEHHAVFHAMDWLERREGFRVTRLGVDREGRVDPDELRSVLTAETTLVSIMSANNETGVCQPVAAVAAVCREREVVFHSDTIQSFGKEPVAVSEAGPDAISLAAHKFHGPKGAGLLWLRAGVPIESLHHGGSHENRRRPGTENAAAIVGLARAAELAVARLDEEPARQRGLRDRLWEGIRRIAPGAVLNGAGADRLCNTASVSFPGLDGESLLMALDLEGVCVSSGSACMVGSVMASHVLLAMGAPDAVARGTVRFSLGAGTTREEIDETTRIVAKVLGRMGWAG
jgi:cysteine desulfurase